MANLTHSFCCIAKYTKKYAPGHPSCAGLHQRYCRARLALLGGAAQGRGRERRLGGDKGDLKATSSPLFSCCSCSFCRKHDASCQVNWPRVDLKCMCYGTLFTLSIPLVCFCAGASWELAQDSLWLHYAGASAVTNIVIVCLTDRKSSVIYNYTGKT